jgi:hypothetical protein
MMPGVHVTWQYTGERCIGFSAQDEDGFPVILRPDFAAVNLVHEHDTMTIHFYRHHLVPREAKGTSIMRKRLWKEFEQTTIDGVPDAAHKLRMLSPAQVKGMRDSKQMRCTDGALQQENEETLDMYMHVEKASPRASSRRCTASSARFKITARSGAPSSRATSICGSRCAQRAATSPCSNAKTRRCARR